LQRDELRLDITQLAFAGVNAVHDTGDFTFRVRRSGSPTLGYAKAAVDCKTGHLAVMTIDNW